jgi:hypothetical protein
MSALSLFGTESWSDYGQVVLQMAMLVTLLSIEQLLQRIAGEGGEDDRLSRRAGTARFISTLADESAEGDLSLEGQCKLSGLPAVPCPSPSLRTGKPSPNSHLAGWGRREDSEIEGPD